MDALKDEAKKTQTIAWNTCEKVQKEIEAFQKRKIGEDEAQKSMYPTDQLHNQEDMTKEHYTTLKNLIDRKLKIAREHVAFFEREMRKQEDDYRNMMDAQDKLQGNMIRAMEVLKKKPLHPKLKQKMTVSTIDLSQTTTGNKETLHDFVNKSNIDKLFDQATESKKKIRDIHELCKSIYKKTKTSLENLEKNMFRLAQNLEQSLEGKKMNKQTAEEKEKIMMNKFNEMQSFALQLETLVHSIETVASKPLFSSFNQKTLEAQLQDYKSQLPHFNTLKVEIQGLTGHYETSDQVESQIKAQEQELDTLLETIDSVRVSFRSLLDEYATEKFKKSNIALFQEIDDLTRWYDYFPIAYDNLLIEIERRNQYKKNFDQKLRQISRELQTMYEQEQNERMGFFEHYGQFLPGSLCPALSHPAEQAQITIDDTSQVLLPDITLTDSQRKAILDAVEARQNEENDDK